MPSDSVFADRVQSVLDIPLHRFLGMQLRDPADPSAGVWFAVEEPAQNRPRCCTVASSTRSST